MSQWMNVMSIAIIGEIDAVSYHERFGVVVNRLYLKWDIEPRVSTLNSSDLTDVAILSLSFCNPLDWGLALQSQLLNQHEFSRT